MNRKLALVAILSASLLAGCAGMPGTTTGIIGGAAAGSIISRGNPLGGAIIGGAAGGILGNIIDQANPQPPRYYPPQPQYYPPQRPYYAPPPQPYYGNPGYNGGYNGGYYEYREYRRCAPCGY